MPQPACVPCERLMKCVQTGAFLEELKENGDPYKLWACDVFACPTCGREVVTGYGGEPIATVAKRQDYDQTVKNVSRIRLIRAR
jgi:hypothetical protein